MKELAFYLNNANIVDDSAIGEKRVHLARSIECEVCIKIITMFQQASLNV